MWACPEFTRISMLMVPANAQVERKSRRRMVQLPAPVLIMTTTFQGFCGRRRRLPSPATNKPFGISQPSRILKELQVVILLLVLTMLLALAMLLVLLLLPVLIMLRLMVLQVRM